MNGSLQQRVTNIFVVSLHSLKLSGNVKVSDNAPGK